MARNYYDKQYDQKYDTNLGFKNRNIRGNNSSGNSLNSKKPNFPNEELAEGSGKRREPFKVYHPKIYVRYSEGAELYSMSRHSFMTLAAEAGAVRKINRLSLVNTQIFEEFLETFQV